MSYIVVQLDPDASNDGPGTVIGYAGNAGTEGCVGTDAQPLRGIRFRAATPFQHFELGARVMLGLHSLQRIQ